jgi:hypothetical protein
MQLFSIVEELSHVGSWFSCVTFTCVHVMSCDKFRTECNLARISYFLSSRKKKEELHRRDQGNEPKEARRKHQGSKNTDRDIALQKKVNPGTKALRECRVKEEAFSRGNSVMKGVTGVVIYRCHHRLTKHGAQRAGLVDDGTYKSQQ